MAVKAYGATFAYGNATNGTSTSFTNIGQIRSLTPAKVSSEDIDITVLDSASEYKEYSPGLADGGEIEITVRYAGSNSTTIESFFRTVKDYRIAYSSVNGTNGAGTIFTAYMSGYGDEQVENGNIVTTTYTFKVTGPPTRDDSI
jgi:hypothetical protein